MNQGSLNPPYELKRESNKTMKDEEDSIAERLDELYDRLRGPAEKMHVLATAYSDKETGGTGRHEPMMMTIDYGQGRVYHTPMGHADYSMECVGFILTFQRGAQWAATGKVTLSDIPDDFPDAQTVRQRSFETQK